MLLGLVCFLTVAQLPSTPSVLRTKFAENYAKMRRSEGDRTALVAEDFFYVPRGTGRTNGSVARTALDGNFLMVGVESVEKPILERRGDAKVESREYATAIVSIVGRVKSTGQLLTKATFIDEWRLDNTGWVLVSRVVR